MECYFIKCFYVINYIIAKLYFRTLKIDVSPQFSTKIAPKVCTKRQMQLIFEMSFQVSLCWIHAAESTMYNIVYYSLRYISPV